MGGVRHGCDRGGGGGRRDGGCGRSGSVSGISPGDVSLDVKR